MDELTTWYEVIRALLPEVYMVRLIAEARGILIGSPYSEELVYLTEEALEGRTPTQVLRRVELELRPGSVIPAARREAC